MTAVAERAFAFPQAWTGADFGAVDDVACDLAAPQLAALGEIMAALEDATLSLEQITRAHFDHPALNDFMAGMFDEIQHGRGLVVLRGLPVERYSAEQAARMLWGLGTHLGVGVSQSALGDLLGHVVDLTEPGQEQSARGYTSRRELNLHNDLAAIVGLMCYRQGQSGGNSIVCNALAIHNAIREKHREHLPVLYRGFRYHRRGEEAEGAEAITPYRIPIFSDVDGALSVFHVREVFEVALRDLGEALTDQERAAVDCFNDLTQHHCFQFRLQPGDVAWMNNYTILHGRNEFTDGEDASRQRHLMRLWLDVPNGRPVVPEIRIYENRDGRSGIDPQPGRTPASADYRAQLDA